jgi:hypothetical protein
LRDWKVFLTIAVVLIPVGIAEAQVPNPQRTPCAQTLPAGLVIRVEPDEKIIAGKTDGPLLLTVTSDVRLFPGKPPIVPRSSKLFARTIESKEAGRLWGRARYQMALETILTPNECEYALEAGLTEAGKFKVEKNAIIGKGHARRDFVLWLFPPTTLYQLIRLPARGPKMVFDEESTLAIRLLQPVQLQESEANLNSLPTPLGTPAASRMSEAVTVGCMDKPQTEMHAPIQLRDAVIRPFRNMTPYHITLAIGKETLTNLGPCFASMVTIPMGDFTITAQAAVLETGGQREVPLDIVVNATGTGWDVVRRESGAIDSKAIATRIQR